MKNLIFVLLIFSSPLTQAVWSGFAHVTPETEEKYQIEVKVLPAGRSDKTYIVKLNAVSFPFKQAWVITTPEPISSEAQNQRNRIWQEELNIAGIESIIPLRPKGIPMFTLPEHIATERQVNNKVYELVLPASLAYRTYIYIDFPQTVDDGGYHYSIDIGSYIAYQSKS